MPRQFRFRVREGHQIFEAYEDRVVRQGPGYEFVMSEEEAARHFRDRRNRHSLELVEVIEDATPLGEPSERG